MPAGDDGARRKQAVADETEDDAFAAAVVEGLSAPQKTLPCRYLYDARGSDLFEQITELPEYYPTRTETAILEANVVDIAEGSGENRVLVEFGSGSSRKTEILIDAMPDLRAYVPIDVSQSALAEARDRLRQRFPDLDIRPILGDFAKPLQLPSELRLLRKIGFFPGSTIGNLEQSEARALLESFRAILAPEGRLIVGVDLAKSEDTLRLAYDDPAGVTAAFNMNLLTRINRTLDADFDLDAFQHEARFNERESRVEMHLVSQQDQTVNILGDRFTFSRGETIHTENSHKYTVVGFQKLAASAGWLARRVWRDTADLFSVHELLATRTSRA